MLNVKRVKMEQNKGAMENIYEESYNGTGSIRRPILSLMMWGPFADYELKKTDKKCDLNNSYGSLHVCENFSEKHYWMYTHGDGVLCETGTVRDLAGPAMTHDLKIIYPCNKSSCNQGCLCDLCLKSQMCPNKEHKKHIKDSNQECAVEKSIQCQDHWISHPENFNEKEDVVVEKKVFYHNKKLIDQPRKHITEKLKFAGIKKSCKLCKSNVKNHFKFHKVIHLQCKYCEYQLKTAFDKNFWNKVCNICGKIVLNINSRQMYWHKRMHTSDWTCDECEIKFKQKWNFRRHLLEVHGLPLHEIDDDEHEKEDYGERSEAETDSSTGTDSSAETDTSAETDSSEEHRCSELSFKCEDCGKEFAVQRYLNAHRKVQHDENNCFQCGYCNSKFAQKKHLKRHEETVQGQQRSDVLNLSGEQSKMTCVFCGVNFSRKDNVHEQVKRLHFKGTNLHLLHLVFICMYGNYDWENFSQSSIFKEKCIQQFKNENKQLCVFFSQKITLKSTFIFLNVSASLNNSGKFF